MNEREKMLAGELYDCGDPQLLACGNPCRIMCENTRSEEE